MTSKEHMRKMAFSFARGYIFPAALWLKDKHVMKPRRLAKYLNITSTRAGRILRVLEWQRLNTRNSHYTNPTYVRPGSPLL